MIRKNTRVIALILIVVMLFASVSLFASAAESDAFSVVVSMEGLTLGQGLYFEPKAYSLDEINSLLHQEGYGPYEQSDLTAGMATLAFLIDHDAEYTMTGDWENSAYLSGIRGVDTGIVNIPSVITENGGPSNENHDGNDDDYLGEFDYGSMSGWIITVNNLMIPVGCSQFGFEDSGGTQNYQDYGNTYVVRWHFTLYGYGADLGYDNGWGMSDPYFEGANKDLLYIAYANSNNAEKKAAARAVMENLTASQQEVDAAAAALNGAGQPEEKPQARTVLNETMAQMAASIPEPVFGVAAGEWTVLSLARGGYYPLTDDYFNNYYLRIVETVKEKDASIGMNGQLHKVKSTENARLIMALSAIGKDATDVGGVNLVAPFDDFTWITKQGINGPIFALIALDTKQYATGDSTIRQQCIEYILSRQLSDGGWALSGTTADPDITAMALQALANYRSDAVVLDAAEKGIACLSAMQKDNGGYYSWGSGNCESIAQVITACTAWGIDPHTDARFIKNGNSAVDALLTFYIADKCGFAHVLESGGGYTGGEVNPMATDQACYALVSYIRLQNKENALYDMTDAVIPEVELAAALTLPENIENKKGTAFNGIISLNGWKDGYRLMDCIVNVPAGLQVNDVSIGSRIGGGSLSYNFEEETGKLRIVYFDAQNGNVLTSEGKNYPMEFFNISFELKNYISAETLSVGISGMTMKQSSDSQTQLVVNTAQASDTVNLVDGLSFSVMTLYTGDGVDLIPATRTAIAVAVTGVENGTLVEYNDGAEAVALRYSSSISEKSGVSTYVAMVDSSKSLDGFIDENNYTVSDGTAEKITFGDANGDGLVNAQDALRAVNLWLRKGQAPDDGEILCMNVTGDSRINTFDALGIVESFVDGADFAVVSRAAALKNIVD